MEQLEQKSFLDEDGLQTVIDTVKDLVDDKVATATGSKVDSELSSTSLYPVQNKVITEALNEKADLENLTSHTDDLNSHVTSIEKENWNDANNKKHAHENEDILNNTTASYTTEEKEKLESLNMNPAGESLGLIQSGGNLTIVNGIAIVNGGNADTASSASDNSDFDFGDITN